MRKIGYLVPNEEITEYSCIKVYYPKHRDCLAVLWGSLHYLAKWVAWSGENGQEKVIADHWKIANEMTRQGESEGCNCMDCCQEINTQLEELKEMILALMGQKGEIEMCNCTQKKETCCNPCEDAEITENTPDTNVPFPEIDLCWYGQWLVGDVLEMVKRLQREVGEGVLTVAKIKAILASYPILNYSYDIVAYILSLLAVNSLYVLTNVRDLIQENKDDLICAIKNASTDVQARSAVFTLINGLEGYSVVTRLAAKGFFSLVSFSSVYNSQTVPAKYQIDCNCAGGGGGDWPIEPSQFGNYYFTPMANTFDNSPTPDNGVSYSATITNDYMIEVSGTMQSGKFLSLSFNSTTFGGVGTVVGYAVEMIDRMATGTIQQSPVAGGDFVIPNSHNLGILLPGEIGVLVLTGGGGTTHFSALQEFGFAVVKDDPSRSPGYSWHPSGMNNKFQKHVGVSEAGGSFSFRCRIWWVSYVP